MRIEGHLGTSLTLGFPILFIQSIPYEQRVCLYIFVIFGSFLPDLDAIPLIFEERIGEIECISHRGFTHTVYFGFLIGVVYYLSQRIALDSNIDIFVPIFVGIYSVLIHCLGDYLTPKGVNLIPPFTSGFSFDYIEYDNYVANVVMLIVQTVVVSIALLISLDNLYTSQLFYLVAVSVSLPTILIISRKTVRRVKLFSPE